MNDTEFQRRVLDGLGKLDERTRGTELAVIRIEGNQKSLSVALQAHEQRDDDRIGALEGQVSRLQDADDTSRQQALTEARTELRTVRTSGDDRRFETWKAIGVALLGGAVTFLIGLLVRSLAR